MLDAEPVVCADCGNVHMEGAAGPDHIEECVVCEGPVEDIELDDIVGL